MFVLQYLQGNKTNFKGRILYMADGITEVNNEQNAQAQAAEKIEVVDSS